MSGTELDWVHELLRLGRAAVEEERPRVVQRRILEHMVEAFGASSGSLALVTTGGDLEIVAAIDLPDDVIGRRVPLGSGVLGWVAAQGQPLLLNGDAASDPRFRPGPDHGSRNPARAASALCWPLRGGDGVRGVIALNRREGDAPFTNADLERGRRLVEILAVVLDNTLFAREARERARELEVAHHNLQRSLDLAQALGDILERAQHAESPQQLFSWAIERIGALPWVGMQGRGTLYVWDEDDRMLRMVAHHGVPDAVVAQCKRLRPGSCLCGRVAAARKPLFRDHVDADHDHRFEGMQDHAHVIMPVRFGDRFFGVLNLYADPGHDLQPWEEEFVEAVANVFAGFLAREETMEEVRLLYRAVESGPTAVVVADETGRVRYVNRRFSDLIGEAVAGARGRHLVDVVFGGLREEGVGAKAMKDVQAGRIWRAELQLARGDGAGRWVAVTVAPVWGGRGGIEHLLAVLEDVTERRRVEEALRRVNAEQKALIARLEEAQNQLLQSEKLAAIGQLAAGVAHEINNPVGYVSSNLGTLRGYIDDLMSLIDRYREAEPRLPDEVRVTLEKARGDVDLDFLRDDVASLLDECAEGIRRVKQIVQDLKDFSRVHEGKWELADLHKGLDSTLNVVWNELKYKAEVIKEYGDIPPVECMLSQLNQVFMNLLVNAAQAIEDKGRIWIRTGAEGDMVWVEIEDTGKGIPPEHLNRIFEPFFTTKPVGKGTGLGLSLSYGIVEKHGGRIEVDSEVGRGTRFRIWLPLRPPKSEGGGETAGTAA